MNAGINAGGAGENRTHDRGFADLGLTTWLPRLIKHQNGRSHGISPAGSRAPPVMQRTRVGGSRSRPPTRSTWQPCLNVLKRKARAGAGLQTWSGRRDLNPRLRPWQGRTLPLSYSRSNSTSIADLVGGEQSTSPEAQHSPHSRRLITQSPL